MSESIIDSKTQPGKSNLTQKLADTEECSDRVTPAKPSLGEEIRRGWEWVVFLWRLLPRIGGFRAWVRTLVFIVSLLIKRMLVQLGMTQKKSKPN